MKLTHDCIPCLVRQTLEAARLVSDDPDVHERLLRSSLSYLNELSFDATPPVVGAEVHANIRKVLNNPDPYREQKDRFNELALHLRPTLEKQVRNAADPFEEAVRLAIAGNVVDFGVRANLSEEDLLRAVEDAAHSGLAGEIDVLRRRVDQAEQILYIADNTGEIVLDRLLLERLPAGRVTVAVRGGPVLNDATMEDARFAGIHDVAPLISSGAAVPGTDLARCSEEFQRKFQEADLIIAKGQGNYESLNDTRPGEIAFLFRVKCDVVARLSGYPLHANVVLFEEEK